MKVKVDFRKACELLGDDHAAIIWEVAGADQTDELEIEMPETMKPPAVQPYACEGPPCPQAAREEGWRREDRHIARRGHRHDSAHQN